MVAGLLITMGAGLAAYVIGSGNRPTVVAQQAAGVTAPTSSVSPTATPTGVTPNPTPSAIAETTTTTISPTSVGLVHDIALAINAAGATLLPAGAVRYAAAQRGAARRRGPGQTGTGNEQDVGPS